MPSCEVTCPFCGEPTEVDVDVDDGDSSAHEFIQDCEVCCHPMAIRARVAEDGEVSVNVDRA